MEFKKLAPWNWFKNEDDYEEQSSVPVRRSNGYRVSDPIGRFHSEMDRMFDEFFSGFGFPVRRQLLPVTRSEWLKPHADVAATEKEYTISVEVPGVEEKDFNLELSDGTLRISGEKRQEKEEKGKNFYRMERSFGSFQRVLSLPEDVDEGGITAKYANGVLTVHLPRKAGPEAESRKIPVAGGKDAGAQKQISA